MISFIKYTYKRVLPVSILILYHVAKSGRVEFAPIEIDAEIQFLDFKYQI